ncbi:MAG: hypothetical protein K0S98_77 [Propionibacteriaceae bacterium]|jgi:hypothetical protein|nr:hypothetical protein [Propionibacteriaceae bacterium]
MSDPANAGGPSGRDSPRSAVAMPRWVKVFLIIAAALVVLMVAVMLVSGGQHGPGRHLSSDWTGSIRYVALPPSSVGWRPLW